MIQSELLNKIRNSFPEYVKFHLELQKFKFAPINLSMAQFLEKPSKVKLLLAARGFAKSTLGIYYMGWRIVRFPNIKIHIVSHKDERAWAIAGSLLKHIESSPILKPFYPVERNLSKYNYNVKFADVTEVDKTVNSSGIMTSRVGCRADLIVCDDVEASGNALTHETRAVLLREMADLSKILHDPLRNVKRGRDEQWELIRAQAEQLPEFCQMLTIGTFQSTESIYLVPEKDDRSDYLPDEGEDAIKKDIGEEEDETDGHPLAGCDVGKFPALDEKGQSTFPEKYSTEELMWKKRACTLQSWHLHYLMDPNPVNSEDAVIIWDKIVKDDKIKPPALICVVDPTSGSKRKTRYDEFACVWGAPIHGGLYIDDLQAWRSEDSAKSYQKIIRECIKKDCHVVHIEGQNPTEISVFKAEILRMSMKQQSTGGNPIRLSVKDFTVKNSNKLIRVSSTLEVVFNSQQITLHPRVTADAKTRDQMKRLRRTSLPSPCDRLDVISSFCILNERHLKGVSGFEAFTLPEWGSKMDKDPRNDGSGRY